MKLALVQLQSEFPDFWDIVPAPRYGVITVSSTLAQAGFDVTAYVEKLVRYTEVKRAAREADIVGCSLFSPNAERTYALADAMRRMGKKVIFGGSHVHYFFEDAMQHCDYAVLCDAESVSARLFQAVAANQPVKDIPGVAWHEGGTVRRNPVDPHAPRFQGVTNIELVKGYPESIRRRKWTGWSPVVFQATRGCPFNCGFCVTPELFNKQFYVRPVEEAVADLKDKLRYTKDIYFVDNNFGGNLKFVRQFCDTLEREGITMNATAYVRHEFAHHPDLLDLMRRVGFTRLLVGIESFVDGTLQDMDKRQSFAGVRDAIRVFKERGFRTSGTFIMGVGNETPETAARYARVAIDLGLDYAFFFVLGVYPHMCAEFVPKERIFLTEFRRGTGHFIFFFPESIRPSRLQDEMVKAHLSFYSFGRILNRLVRGKFKDVSELTYHRLLFLRLRYFVNRYQRYVRHVEAGLYDGDKLNMAALRQKSVPKLSCYH
jgi:bacteriochlorophyll C8 methyltransferase